MSFLLDTNIVSELRKGTRCDPNVSAWYYSLAEEDVFLSVLTLGELRKGIELLARRDAAGAHRLRGWLTELASSHRDRILPVDREVAERWGSLNVPDPLPVIDGLLAATALVHAMTLATRNVEDVVRTGVPVVNPFLPPAA